MNEVNDVTAEVTALVARLREILDENEEYGNKQKLFSLSDNTLAMLEILRQTHKTYSEIATLAIHDYYHRMIAEQSAISDDLDAVAEAVMSACAVPVRMDFQHEPRQRFSHLPQWTIVKFRPTANAAANVRRALAQLGVGVVTTGTGFMTFETQELLNTLKGDEA